MAYGETRGRAEVMRLRAFRDIGKEDRYLKQRGKKSHMVGR